MRSPLVGVGIIGISLVFAAAARAEIKAGDSTLAIQQLVVQLGDRNFRARQAAGQALESRGEETLPALRQALTHDDEEIRRRAEVLIQKIERTALLTPKRVTIRMKDRPVEEVVKELARQTGYKLVWQGGQPRKVSVEMENVSYWQAMEKICNDAGLNPGFDDQQGIVYLYQQDTVSPYTYHTGPFRLVAQNFNYNRYVNLANIPRNINANFQNHNNLHFGFLIQSEPKAPLLSVGPPRLSKAEDENGASLMPWQSDEGQFNAQFGENFNQYRNFQHQAAIAMAKPAKEATRANIIKGKVLVTLLAGTKPDVVIEKIVTGKKKLDGTGRSAEIEIEEVAEQNKTWTLTLFIKKRMRTGEGQDFNWINTVQQKLELYDAKGRKFQSHGVINFMSNTGTSVKAVYQFGAPPNAETEGGVKLVLAEWLTLSQELEFEFKNLPLP
jgi:hypothetical protein